MSLVVQKFGGTSVGTVERIRAVAQLLAKTQQDGNQVVAVISAMSGETNRLVGLANAINPMPWSLEYDMLLAAGEQQAIALVALAINSIGAKAKPLLAHQIGIKTDSVYSKARILDIHTEEIKKLLDQNIIPVIAGFQGVDSDNQITTLGRGGSDTSAVAIAAALNADDCEIYTDVDGIYTTDPRLCSKAKKMSEVSYDVMIELASLGAKVLQIRSVELAAKYKVPLHVRSSFDLVPGTRIVGEKKSMETVLVSGVAAESDCARFNLSNLPDSCNTLVDVFAPIAEAGIVVDIITQNRMDNGTLKVAFTASEVESEKVKHLVQTKLINQFPHLSLESETGLAKVSIVGVGMRNHPGVAAKAFKVVSEADVKIVMIATSEIKVSMVVDRNRMKDCVEKLHDAFQLEQL